MTHSKGNAATAKDKITGKMEEGIGRVTGNQQMELKGKILSMKSDLKGKTNISDMMHNVKENIAEKINDGIDKKNNKK